MHLHWIQCLYTMYCHSRLVRFIQMSLASFAPRPYGPHSAPGTMWLADQCFMLPAHWFTYVYDTFVVGPRRKKELQEFVLHGIHQNITLTMEIEENAVQSFTDVLVSWITRLLKLYTQYIRKLHQAQTQPGTEIGCTSHSSTSRWYTVWPPSLVDENCTHAQVTQVQLRSKGLRHLTYSLWVRQSIRQDIDEGANNTRQTHIWINLISLWRHYIIKRLVIALTWTVLERYTEQQCTVMAS